MELVLQVMGVLRTCRLAAVGNHLAQARETTERGIVIRTSVLE